MVKYGGDDAEEMQRFAEGQNLEIRLFLEKYESAIEGQRLKLQALRQSVLRGERHSRSDLERIVALRTIDDLWSRHLAETPELRSGLVWISYGRDPLHEYLLRVDEWFRELEASLEDEIARRLRDCQNGGVDPAERGAVWTYITHDQFFHTFGLRMGKGMLRRYPSTGRWARVAIDAVRHLSYTVGLITGRRVSAPGERPGGEA